MPLLSPVYADLAGVPTTLGAFPDTVHSLVLLDYLPESRTALGELIQFAFNRASAAHGTPAQRAHGAALSRLPYSSSAARSGKRVPGRPAVWPPSAIRRCPVT